MDWKLTHHLHALKKCNTCLSLQPYKHMRLQRESSCVMKLDMDRLEDWELRERVMELQEENAYIQREISSMSSKDGQWKGKSRSWSLKSTLTPREWSKPNLRCLWMLWMQRRKLEQMSLTYRICQTSLLHTSPTQDLLPERFTAFALLCLLKP